MSNTLENALNEICQIKYSLYRSKEITKKVYWVRINSLQNKMNTIFMNSENCKLSISHRIILNFTDKINLKWGNKYVALSNLSFFHTSKNIKTSQKNNKFKISAPTWNDKF